jgi:hypothetical protein
MLRALCVVGAALAMTPAASAEIFKCIAKSGLTLYQNFPCEIDSLGNLPSQPAGGKPSPQPKTIQADAKAPQGSSAAMPPRAQASEPSVGMTADEAKAIWGEPAEVVQDEPRSGRVEIWQYEDGRVVQINQKRRVISVQR